MRTRRALALLAHPGHAGMLRALAALEGGAARRGWQLRYVLPAPPQEVAGAELPAERTVVVPALGRWRTARGLLGRPGACLSLVRLVSTERVDLLYSCTLSTLPACLAVSRVARVPHVVHVYSGYAEPRSYRKHGLARARTVIAPSADALARASEAVGGFGPAVRTGVVHNGVDIARIEQAARGPLPRGLCLPGAGPVVGMLGNLDRRKSPATLVEAAATVRRRVPDAVFVLIGGFTDPGYEREVRRRMAALGLDGRVIVAGFQSNPFPLLARVDVVAHPALADPFPLALLEAMALGKPVVASRVGGIPEMIADGEGGILVPPGDAAALADALAELLVDRDRAARLGRAGRARLERRFSLRSFVEAMFAVFEEAVSAG